MVNFLWDNLFRRSGPEAEIEKLLKDTYVFALLNRKELSLVRQVVHTRTYRPGELIFRQGEVGIGMYIIMKGTIDVQIEDNSVDADSQEILVTQLAAGDFFGELSLVEDNGRRTANAVARSDATLIAFFKPDLMEIVDRNPSTGVKIIIRLAEVLGRRLKETTGKVSELKRDLRRLTGNP